MAIIDQKASPEPGYFSNQIRTARRFFNPDTLKTGRENYRVVSGGIEICIPGYKVMRDNFNYWALELVSSGRGTLHLNGRSFNLLPGSVYLYGPGIPHQISADRGEAMEKYFIDVLPGDSVQKSFSIFKQFISESVLYSHSLESLKRTFEEITEYGRLHTERSEDICSKFFEVLLMKISETATGKCVRKSSAYEAYRRCNKIIENRYLEISTVQEAADEANIDISYLCRLFKKFGTQTPYRLITELRMNHAAGMLIRDGMSVKHVALELGYDSPFTFSRRFKHSMGISPLKFTEEYKSGNPENPTH
ncbi:MAG: helix-turn-helix domain-containing protein [Spirochaetaceae bacterium]|nr:helix-turn-helix domain-containing protein [Spirochaetaceae bacterium]